MSPAAPLDNFVVSREMAGRVEAVIDDLIVASIAQDAYQRAWSAPTGLGSIRSAAFEYASRTPYAFAQAWVRCLRDISEELRVLAGDAITGLGARRAGLAFGQAFPGVAATTGPMRILTTGRQHAAFVAGSARVSVRIDDAGVRDLEVVVQTLIDGLPKADPGQAAG